MNDREFVSTAGTVHRGERVFDEFITDCRRVFKIGIVKQQPVKDCMRCYPKEPDMHDPMVVAFTIVRPWPSRSKHHDAKLGKPRWAMRRGKSGHAASPWWRAGSYSRFWTVAGRGLYWPALITVWHVEPGGRDSGEVCKHHQRWQDETGKWHSKPLRAWRWHVQHWSIQAPPLQELRRRLLTRCEWCGGRSGRRDSVDVSHSWDGEKQPWWRGERGLYHHDCSTVHSAHQTCTCSDPLLKRGDYGNCMLCGRFRSWQPKAEWLAKAERIRELIPAGSRNRPMFDVVIRDGQ